MFVQCSAQLLNCRHGGGIWWEQKREWKGWETSEEHYRWFVMMMNQISRRFWMRRRKKTRDESCGLFWLKCAQSVPIHRRFHFNQNRERETNNLIAHRARECPQEFHTWSRAFTLCVARRHRRAHIIISVFSPWSLKLTERWWWRESHNSSSSRFTHKNLPDDREERLNNKSERKWNEINDYLLTAKNQRFALVSEHFCLFYWLLLAPAGLG